MSYSESFTECHSQVVSILASYFECPMLKSWFIVIEVLWFSVPPGKCRNSILNYVIIINPCNFIVLINKLSEKTNLGLQFFLRGRRIGITKHRRSLKRFQLNDVNKIFIEKAKKKKTLRRKTQWKSYARPVKT